MSNGRSLKAKGGRIQVDIENYQQNPPAAHLPFLMFYWGEVDELTNDWKLILQWGGGASP